MDSKSWRVGVLAILFALVVLCRTSAQDGKATDEGKAEDFKGKSFDIKEKGKVAIILAFPAGKKASVTVRSKAKTDVNLYVYDAAKKVVAKDDSPGPDCDLTFTPKEAGKFVLEVVNLGPGANTSTLKVEFVKEKAKADGGRE
jgi:hypothetical protein